jgi:hypothetical protein
LLLQTVAVEARQQQVFRQFEGLFPMPVWFEAGISQSMAWTLLAPYMVSCPAENPRIAWQNFPALNVTVRFFFLLSRSFVHVLMDFGS